MSNPYRRILELLDELGSAELAQLMGVLAQRLQGTLEAAEDSDETDEEGSRRYLPRLPKMIEWGVIIPMEDKLFVKGIREKPALLLDGYRVAYEGEPLSINNWAKLMTGWSSINIYEWVVVERTNQTLDEMRRDYMVAHGIE